eukprot:263798-Chlamydomonas_euryale.AAC.2
MPSMRAAVGTTAMEGMHTAPAPEVCSRVHKVPCEQRSARRPRRQISPTQPARQRQACRAGNS